MVMRNREKPRPGRDGISPTRRLAVVFALALVLAPFVNAADFGILVKSDNSFVGRGPADGGLVWGGLAIPWFSTILGDNADLYLSAGINGVRKNDEFIVVPELFRSEFDLRFGTTADLKLGRMHYSDPLGFIAEGLFDGFRFAHNIGGGSWHLGAWYTGLMYKKNADIMMNDADNTEYYADLDYGDFYRTYFASKRVLTVLGFEHPAFMEVIRADIAFIGQFDVNQLDDNGDDLVGRNSRLHSQYIAGKMLIPVTGRVIVEGGAVLELAETTAEKGGNLTALAGAAEAGLSFLLSSSIRDRFRVLGRLASGGTENSAFGPFTPVTTEKQGAILSGKLGGEVGLSLVRAEYTARLKQNFSAEVSSSLFFKDKNVSYQNQNFRVEDGYFLGCELYGRLVWSPLSDVMVDLGGGAFFPRSDTDPVWKMSLSATIAIY
jgi:hypothetical protein